jgi:hypothetical protein
MRRNVVAIVSLWFALIARAETRRIDVTASFSQPVPAADTTLFFDGSTAGVPCHGAVSPSHQLRCSAHVKGSPQFARVEIRALGFKLFSRNVPRLAAQRKVISVTLGNVTLKPADIQVVQITSSLTEKNQRLYEITVRNNLKRKVEVIELAIEGVLETEKTGCLVEGPNRYTVDDTLHLTTSAATGPSVTGLVRISDRGETLTRQLSGTLATETCKQNAHLALRLPISFTIRDTDLTAVSIALPKTLHVVPAPQTPPWARRQDIPVDAFARLTFSLRTDAPEQPDVAATYNVAQQHLVKIF